MNLPSQTRIEFQCAICGTDCVDIMDRVAKRHPKDSICQVCEEQCESEAEAAVIWLMVDSVTRDMLDDPYARTTTCWVHEYHPPTYRTNNWLGLFIAVVLVISAAVALGRCAG